MDLLRSRENSDEFGSVYSFDGLAARIKNHNLAYTKPGSLSFTAPVPIHSNGNGVAAAAYAPAVTNSRIRRFSVFSNQAPAPAPPPCMASRLAELSEPHIGTENGSKGDQTSNKDQTVVSRVSTFRLRYNYIVDVLSRG